MKAVGVKNLKNNLSRYLNLVREGETVYVTDRDEIIAEIHRPTSAPGRLLSRWEAFLNQQERSGSIVRALREDSTIEEDTKPQKTKRPAAGLSLQELLDETRADRF
jgi:antitoxin (DNA-binding transcriptional repressor) of toxin-antitoxin stability system